MELESRLHETLPTLPCLALFQYDQTHLPAEMIRDVILTHETVIHGMNVYRNPRAVTPEQFLGRDRTAREVDRLLGVLSDQKALLDETARLARSQEAKYQSLVASLHEGAVLQEASGRIVLWNPAAERAFGIGADVAVGESSTTYDWKLVTADGDPLPGDDHPSMRTLRTGEPCSDVVLGITRPNGERRWLSVSTEPVWDRTGTPQRISAVAISFADITEWTRAQEQLADMNALLEHRVRQRTSELQTANDELEAFNYSVSHDLRAPLRHISGFANLLREEAGDDLSDEQRHCFQRIDSAVGKMGQLIDDLIEFSKVSRSDLQLTEADNASLVAEAIEAVQPDAGARAIEWVVGELPPAFADAPALRLVWTNLLDNAVKYTAPHGRARIEIGGRVEGDETVYWVRDDGVGFEPVYADKLFGVFERLHNDDRFSGTGIGLATVRRVVARHGGRAWAEGAVEGGAAFWFSLPRQTG